MDDRTLALFMGKVDMRPNGCWLWTGHITKDGYGTFYLASAGRGVLAHRVSYEHFMEEDIPPGMDLDHLCHTLDKSCAGGITCQHRRCVMPATLQPVTPYENLMRGNAPSALNATKTHCPQGHEYLPENTYIDPRGRRECRICRAEQAREWLRVHHPGVRHGTETHCPQGHPYAGDNLIITSNGGRACRECKRTWSRNDMRRRRAAAKADREQARLDHETAELAGMADVAELLGPAGAGPLTLF
jgi:hypothetical protein